MTETKDTNVSKEANVSKETCMPDVKNSIAAFEKALDKTGEGEYVLHLYVAGMGPKSVKAINNIKHICEEFMPDKYQLEVIDIYQYPIFDKDDQIVAAPTLIKELPPPLRRIIGSMSDTERVLVGMDLKSRDNDD